MFPFLERSGNAPEFWFLCTITVLTVIANVFRFFLAEKFEKGKVYTEKEVNDLLRQWHTFDDPATLRRELYNHRFLNRDSYGKEYSLEEIQPDLEELERRYG